MIKTITINEGGQELTLNGSLSWCLLYRDQFGEDPLQMLAPYFDGFAKIAGSMDQQPIKAISDILSTAKIGDVLNVIWALAQNGQPPAKRKTPTAFFTELGDIEFDLILPSVLEVVVGSCMSKKKAESVLSLLSLGGTTN